jgi:predicted DNA-binding transcriptional regulator AlpA
MSELIIPIKEAAKRTSMSTAEFYRGVKDGRLPCPVALTAKRRGIRVADLEAWVANLPTVVPDQREHFKKPTLKTPRSESA